MPESDEKRAMRRFLLQLPIELKSNGEYLHLQTRDVSARGICFRTKSAVAEGTDISFIMTLPPEITLTEAIRVRCEGRVLRVDKSDGSADRSVVAVIERYEFLGRS